MHLRRSLLITPANSPRKLARAAQLDVDAVILDLEDGVAPNAKAEARKAAIAAFSSDRFNGKERMIRINAVDTPWFWDDIVQVVTAGVADALVLPKANSGEDVKFVSRIIDQWECSWDRQQHNTKSLELVPLIETATGILNVDSIAKASPRVTAIIFGSGDFSAETGAQLGPDTLAFPRSRIAIAAASAGIDAVDGAYFADVRDETAVAEDAATAARFGFTGKLVFHPSQVDAINRAFTPTAEEIRRARRIMAAYEDKAQEGVGVFEIDGEFVAIDIVKRYQRRLAIAERLGL